MDRVRKERDEIKEKKNDQLIQFTREIEGERSEKRAL